MRHRLRTTLGGLGLGAALMLVAGCDMTRTDVPPGGNAHTMTAPPRAGAVPSGTTASGESPTVNPNMGGPGSINRGYNLGANPNVPSGTGTPGTSGP